MITTSVLDPALSSRLCLTLVHSLWQVVLLAAIVWCCERLLSWSVERRYLMHVAALVIALVLLPVTFAVVDVETPGEAAIARQVGVDEPQQVLLAPIEVAAPSIDVEATSGAAGAANPQAVDDAELAGQQANSVAAVDSPAETSLWTLIAPWLAAGYIAGVGLMLLRIMFGVWAAQRLVTRSRPVSDSVILLRLEQLTRRLAVRSRPVVAYSEQVLVPQIVGLLRPVILLPTSAMTGLAPEQVEMVLAHELTHLRRHDMWVNLLQRVAEAVLFFSPPLWYLSHRINVLREYCCDDAVCRATSDDADDVRCRYAAALLQVAELSRSSAALGRRGRTPGAAELTSLAAAGGSPSQLRRRISRLVGEPIREPLHFSRGGLLTLLTVLIAVILSSSLWPVIAQTDEAGAAAEQREPTSDDAKPRRAADSRVEVIAIGTHNEKPQRWWDPSGKIIETPPFEWTEGHDVSGDNRQWRRVVIRVHDLAEGEEVRWEISGEPDSWGATVTVDGEKNPRGYYTQQFVVPKGQRNIRLRVGVASGEWKTVAAFGTHNTIEVKDAEPSFISAGTFEEEGGTTLFLTHDAFKPNVRVVAVDKEGRTHDSGYRGGLSTGTKVYQSRMTFRGLSREQIDHFKFQTRPYEWTEIEDLSLEPRTIARNAGAAPALEDRPELDSTAVRLEDGTTVRLVGVSNNRDRSDDKEWWKPDGEKLAVAPYSEPGTYSNERTAYEFAFEVTGSENFGFAGRNGDSVATPRKNQRGIADMRAVVSSRISAGAREAEVTVGIATGKWQLVEEWKGYQWDAGAGHSTIRNKEGIVLTWPRQQDNAVEVMLAHNYVDEQTRLVALHEEQLVEGKAKQVGEGDGIAAVVYRFNMLRLDDQFELAFERRPYKWVRFNNVSLRPGHLTNARAEASEERAGDAPTAATAQQLEEVLREWEKKSAEIKGLRGEHRHYEYDKTFGIEKRAVGEFWLESPDKARIDFHPASLEDARTGEASVSGKKDASGQPYKIEADDAVTWVCDGRSIIQVEHEPKTYAVSEIPPHTGENIGCDLLPILFGINPFAVEADKLKQRYKLSLGSQHDEKGADGGKSYHIVALPRMQSDARNWQRVEIILDAEFCLPTAIRLVDATGTKESVYVFPLGSMKAGAGDLAPDPFRIKLWGYKLIAPPSGEAKQDEDHGDGTDSSNRERATDAGIDR